MTAIPITDIRSLYHDIIKPLKGEAYHVEVRQKRFKTIHMTGSENRLTDNTVTLSSGSLIDWKILRASTDLWVSIFTVILADSGR